MYKYKFNLIYLKSAVNVLSKHSHMYDSSSNSTVNVRKEVRSFFIH